MTHLLVLFFGSSAFSIEQAMDYRVPVSMVRYADDDMIWPSCSDWQIPNTLNIWE